MIIGKYKVLWRSAGWSYAEPVVYEEVPFLWLWTRWKEVWTGPSRAFNTAKKMHRKEQEKWFLESLEEYEAFCKSWEEAA